MDKRLTLINSNGVFVADSREVAEMSGVRHSDLLEKIGIYIKFLENGKFRSLDFFIPSTYKVDGNNKNYDCYLMTRKGCDMVANKMTGEKGVLFTAAYVTRFEEMERQQLADFSNLSPQLQFLISLEQQHNALAATVSSQGNDLQGVKAAVEDLTETMTATPEQSEVVDKVNEYARWTRTGHNEVWNTMYDTLKKQHGIDIKARIENERERVQSDYHAKTGKWYAESTLKGKVNGVDVAVRIGCIDKLHSIISAMLAKEKMRGR